MRDHDGRENIHRIHLVELLDGDLLQRVIPTHAGVVDENVNQKLAILAAVSGWPRLALTVWAWTP